MGSLVSEGEKQIRYFQNNYPKLALKNYAKDLQPGFPHSVRTSCPNFKKVRRQTRKTVINVCFMTLICPILNGMFPFQIAPKVTLHPSMDFIFIMEFYKLDKIDRKSTRKSLQSKHKRCMFGIIIPIYLSTIILRLCNMVCCVLREFREKFEKFTKIIEKKF